MAKAPKPIRIKIGKGVMSKDNRTPWAAGTINATNRHGMMTPHVFSHETVARLLADETVMEIQVIDVDNVQSTITKTWVERDEAGSAALRARFDASFPTATGTASRPGRVARRC